MIKESRIVNLHDINCKPNTGKPPRIYGYTNKDLAQLFEVSEEHIRNLIYKGSIDPMNLRSIITYFNNTQKV